MIVMSKVVYDRNGEVIELQEVGEVQNYPFYQFDVHTQYGIVDAVEGIKKIYPSISATIKPVFVWLNSGPQSIAIIQKTSSVYGSVIIFGYYTNVTFMRLIDGTWHISNL